MAVKTDIEIAQEAKMLDIRKVAAKAGITNEDDLELYGKYKAKISDEAAKALEKNEDGKLILVTAINPTPAGEGKTTISIGLTEALCHMGKNAVAALREPSLGPCFGIKGGAAGGPGCADGRFKSAFYGRFPRNYICKQSACGNVRQSYSSGQCTPH